MDHLIWLKLITINNYNDNNGPSHSYRLCGCSMQPLHIHAAWCHRKKATILFIASVGLWVVIHKLQGRGRTTATMIDCHLYSTTVRSVIVLQYLSWGNNKSGDKVMYPLIKANTPLTLTPGRGRPLRFTATLSIQQRFLK